MKQFKFKLQTVHDLRESRLESAERELGVAMNDLQRAQLQLQEVQQCRQQTLERYLLLCQSKEMEVASLTAHTEFLGTLLGREQEVRKLIAQCDHVVAAKRRLVTEAMQATETTAKLRDRQQQRHAAEVDRYQQSSLDEMAVLAVARRRITTR